MSQSETPEKMLISTHIMTARRIRYLLEQIEPYVMKYHDNTSEANFEQYSLWLQHMHELFGLVPEVNELITYLTELHHPTRASVPDPHAPREHVLGDHYRVMEVQLKPPHSGTVFVGFYKSAMIASALTLEHAFALLFDTHKVATQAATTT